MKVDDLSVALRMTDEGQIYLMSTASPRAGAVQRWNIIVAYWQSRVFPPRRRGRWSFAHYKVIVAPRLTIKPFHKFAFIDDFRRRTDTSGPGAFDLAPAVAMAT